MRLASFADLCNLLEDRDVPHHRDDMQSAVEIPTKIRGEQFVGVVVWDPRAQLLQVIQPLIFDLPVERDADVALALAHINHALVLPGFGLDAHNRRIYYRWVVPREEDGTLKVRDFDKAIRAVLETCRDFVLPLRSLVEGTITPDAVLAEATKLREQPPAG